MVNKARLIEKMAELVRDKKIDGITAITDESSREGMRINIELRRDVNANVVLNQLFQTYTAPGYLWCDHACTGKQSAESHEPSGDAPALPDTSGRCCYKTYTVRTQQSRRTCTYLKRSADRTGSY